MIIKYVTDKGTKCTLRTEMGTAAQWIAIIGKNYRITSIRGLI